MSIEIREEIPQDIPAIHQLNALAFDGPVEADLVDRLRQTCPERLSLVAVEAGEVVGHILFTPATIQDGEDVRGMGLAPMAVLPSHQRTGIGTRLVSQGMERLRAQGCPFVIVLGHPAYYPRFGFVKASRHGIRSQWQNVPDEAFMVAVLRPDAIPPLGGTAYYREEFNAAMQETGNETH